MLLFGAFLQAPNHAGTDQSPASSLESVVVVRLEGPLSPTWASLLHRAEQAVATPETVGFVLELDTPGGELELMKQLGDQIDVIARLVPSVCFVDRQALSAGSYLAMSCERIVLTPGGSIGAAMPIVGGPAGMLEVDEDTREKMNSAVRAEFRSWAELHGRDPRIAEAFVDRSIEIKRVSLRGETQLVNAREFQDLIQQGESPRFLETVCAGGELLTLTAQQAMELAWADGVSESLEELLVERGWGETTVRWILPNWSESLVEAIASWAWLLMLAAGFFVVVSFQLPGLGAPEISAALTLGLFLFHHHLIGLAEWTEVLFVVSGLLLIAAEVLVLPGTLFLGAGGAVLLLVGLTLSLQGFVLPEGDWESQLLRTNLLSVLGVFVGAPILGITCARLLVTTRAGSVLATEPSESFGGGISGQSSSKSTPLPGVGKTGTCQTDLRPSGTITIDGQPYDAVSDGAYIDLGASIRVAGRRGPSLLVKPYNPQAS